MEVVAVVGGSQGTVFGASPSRTIPSRSRSASFAALLLPSKGPLASKLCRQFRLREHCQLLSERKVFYGVDAIARKKRIHRLPAHSRPGPPGQRLITCRSSAPQEALPAPPESWPIEPPLEKVEHERYMYPADTLPGYVSHSKDPRVPVKHRTVSAHQLHFLCAPVQVIPLNIRQRTRSIHGL